MEKFIRLIFFFILAPIYGTLSLFLHFTYAWWMNLHKKGGIINKIFFVILAPIYGPIALFLNNPFCGYDWWASLYK